MVNYTLYYHPASLYSCFVRYALSLRGPPKDAASEMTVEQKLVNIYASEQLSEGYLCNINPKGQVPVLASIMLEKPVPDSLVIAHYLMERYPRLAPEAHKAQINELLQKLHGINVFSLVFEGKQPLARAANAKVEALIADENISDRFREALRYKLKINETEKTSALEPGQPEANQARAVALMAEIEPLLPSSDDEDEGPWLWGLPHATVLDAHFVAFVGRLLAIGRGAIVPEKVKAYAERAMAGEEWQGVKPPV